MADSVAAMKCPACGKTVKFPPAKVGATAKCPGCSGKLKLVDQKRKSQPPAVRAQPAEIAAEKVAPEKPAKPSLPSISVPPVPILLKSRQHADLPAVQQDSDVNRFAAEGQDPTMIAKLLSRINEICTKNEEPLYMAVQQRPAVNLSPDAVVVTNRRAIIFRQKMLGRMEFVDVPWMHIADVHVKEGILGATLLIKGRNGHVEEVDYLPKAQARRVYRIGQEMEEEMVEHRRQRKMEEDRNAAGNVTVNAAISNPSGDSGGQDDLTSRLRRLKEMHDAGLITDEEFTAKRNQIMDSL